MDVNQNQSQSKNCFEQGLVQYDDSFIVVQLVGVVIQAGEIQIFLMNRINKLEHI